MSPAGSSEAYINKLAAYGFENIVRGPTRMRPTCDTAIDHIFIIETNVLSMESEVIDSCSISDYAMSRCRIDLETNKRCGTSPVTRTKWKKFGEEVGQLEVEKYCREMNPDIVVGLLLEDVELCKNRATDICRNDRRAKPLKPSISQNIIACTKRHGLWRLYKRFAGNRLFGESYRKYRNEVRQLTRTTEGAYLREQIENAVDPRRAWKVIDEEPRGKR